MMLPTDWCYISIIVMNYLLLYYQSNIEIDLYTRHSRSSCHTEKIPGDREANNCYVLEQNFI